MTPAQHNITVYRGDTKKISLKLTRHYVDTGVVENVDVTGLTFAAQIRQTQASETPDATFTVQVTNATAGELTLTLPSAQSAVLSQPAMVWDLQSTDAAVPANVQTWLYGNVTVLLDVTR